MMNKVMNKDGDWKPSPHPAHPKTPMTLHPSNIIGRAQEFANAVAMALDQPVERNGFNREEGFVICARLAGFGLAHQMDAMTELPFTNYAYRLSVRGVILLRLLGESVPNYEYYIQNY